jgi:hypothetical protein
VQKVLKLQRVKEAVKRLNKRKNKDLTLMIMFAILLFLTSFISQGVSLATGILRLGLFVNLILYAIIFTLVSLIFEGRRWKIFGTGTLFALLSIPTYTFGLPFFIPKIGTFILTAFSGDVMFNSGYAIMKRKRLLLWCVVSSCFFFTILLGTNILNYLIFIPATAMFYLQSLTVLLPVAIVEATIGACIGYGIYRRVHLV